MRFPGGYVLSVYLLVAFPATAQKPAAVTVVGPLFEAASVRPTPLNAYGGPRSGIAYGYFRNDRVNISERLRQTVGLAYGVATNQVIYPKQFTSIMRGFFDIHAVATRPATDAEFRVMLQALLADRFKLAAQTETKAVPGYALVVAKGGPKNLKPMPPPGGTTLSQFARTHLFVEEGYWADSLTTGARPVDDETGIEGTFDLWPGPFGHAGFSPAAFGQLPEHKPEPLSQLLEDKLGLALVKRTVSREFVTITHVEPPTPN